MTTGNGNEPRNGTARTEADLARDLLEQAEKAALEPAALARLSVQARTEPGESMYPWTFWVATAADEAPGYWTASRDDYLRGFWKTEPMLAGAVYSFESRLRTLGWTIDGPQRQVNRYQQVLSESEFGAGWPVMIGKVVEDLLCQDRGAFVELLRPGSGSDGPVVGLAHLDASRCLLTGDLEYPVIYLNHRTGVPHKMASHQVLHLVSQPSPDETLKGVGFCPVSRVLRAAQIMRDIWTYKREKLSSRPTRGVVVAKGVRRSYLEEAFKEAQEQQDNEGLTRFAKVVFIAAQDEGVPLDLQMLDFASLPDGYNEETSTTLYAYVLALTFGVDAREFWPATASGATKADALVQAMKARGKGFGDVLSLIERQLNWAVLPRSLTFRFDFQDDEEDRARAELDKVRIDNVVKLFTVPTGMAESVIDRTEARRLLADVQVLPEEFLVGEPDVTPDVVADDIEQPTEEGEQQEAAPTPAEPPTEEAPAAAAEVAAKELARLFGPPVRYSSKSGRTVPLEPYRPFGHGGQEAARRKAKTGTSPTRDVPLPDDTEERTARLERSMERAALAGLQAVERLVLAEVRKLPEAQKEVVAEKASPVPLADDDDDLWRAVEQTLVEALGPQLTAAAQAGAAAAAEGALSAVAVGVDMALVNESVLKWSREYTYDLVGGINKTTQDALGQAITTWQENGLGKRGLPDLVKAIEPLFGRERAQLIASTEVTRAFSEGNFRTYKSIPGMTGKRWLTGADERVCPRCGPLHRVVVALDGDFPDVVKAVPFPPLHPRCRCRISGQMEAPSD